MAKILFLHRDPDYAGFIADDLAILRARHDVIDVRATASPAAALELGRGLDFDLVVFWWGDLTGALGVTLARLRRRPAIMMTGGYDVASVPELGYGLRHDRRRARLPELCLGAARLVIASSTTSAEALLAERPELAPKLRAIPHGLDPAAIAFGGLARGPAVLAVGQVRAATLARKGWDRLAEAARALPHRRFRLAGPLGDEPEVRAFVADAPPNLELLGHLPRARLLLEMRRARVIVQLSAHEGFGLAVAEAMLAGATPVVSDRGALPEVVGDVGEVVPRADPARAVEAIERAWARPEPERARRRIAERFPLSLRAERLLAAVAEC